MALILSAKLAIPVAESTMQGAASGASNAVANNEPVLPGAVQGATVGAALGSALPVAGAAARKVASGALRRSDNRIVDAITEGASAKQRRAVNKDERDVINVVRSEPELARNVEKPASLVQAARDQLDKTRGKADEIYKLVRADPQELVAAARARQAELKKDISTRDLARRMEPHIKLLEEHAKEVAESNGHDTVGAVKTNKPDNGATEDVWFGEGDLSDKPGGRFAAVEPGKNTAPGTGAKLPNNRSQSRANEFDALDEHDVSYTPAERSKFLAETGLPASIGNTTGQTEVGTVASPGRKPPAAVTAEATAQPTGTVGGRSLRQLITDHEDQASNVIPGTKPTADQRAQAEFAGSIRKVLDEKVAAAHPEAAEQLAELNRKTSALVRIKNAAAYKAENNRVGNNARLTQHGHNMVSRIMHGSALPVLATEVVTGHPAAALGTAGAMLAGKVGPGVARAADEALARLARAARSGGNIGTYRDAALRAGVKQATVDAMIMRLTEGK